MKHFWYLLFFKVKCRLKAEASTSYLNYGWWVIEPLLHMGVFYLVFGVLMSARTENFVLFLLTGLIPWLWFSKSIGNSTASIFSGRNVMMQSTVPIALFPLEVVFQDSVKQLLVFSLLFALVAVIGDGVTVHWLALLPLILVQLALISAVSFVTAMIVPFIPDMRYLVNTGLTLMMFGSGVFYSDKLISPEYHKYFYLNPMANIIRNYREILIEHHWPNWADMATILLASLVFLISCVYILKNTRTTYVRLAMESK
jgi:lipopolysaccharide transport system permease protein